MAALTAASWTVVITGNEINGRKRRVRGTLALAGTDTYPTAGIPLPTIDKLGMKRQLDYIEVFGNIALTTEYLLRYSKAAHKLLVYEEEAAAAGGPLLEADTAEVPGPRTWDFVAEGW